jgi:hypothetical protein
MIRVGSVTEVTPKVAHPGAVHHDKAGTVHGGKRRRGGITIWSGTQRVGKRCFGGRVWAAGRPENDIPSNLARVERGSRSLRVSCIRPFRSRQP